LDQALELTSAHPKVFVAGGGELYVQALDRAHTLVLTHVDADLQGTVKFPAWREEDFEVTTRSEHVDAKGVPFVIAIHERRTGAKSA
jgi:dihydrofolate reductase